MRTALDWITFRSGIDASRADDKRGEVPEQELFYSILSNEHVGYTDVKVSQQH